MKFNSYLAETASPSPWRGHDSALQLRDSFARTFNYLRLSITERCNFRCEYCLPNGYQAKADQAPELSRLEIQRLVRGFVTLGLTKVRLTGGEPSLRKDLCAIIADIAAIPSVKVIALSTNGYRLARDMQDWANAGLSAVNVSIDSLDPVRFAKMTGSDSLTQILKGVQQTVDAGLLQVKINAVLNANTDTSEILRFIEFVKRQPVTVRFIELMETGNSQQYFESNRQSSTRLVQYLLQNGWTQMVRANNAGPAIEFQHRDSVGRIGVIAPYASGFCDTCNRLRVSAQGRLHTCLFASNSHPLRELLQHDAQQAALQQRLEELTAIKTASHQLHEGDTGINHGFSGIGG